MSWTEEPIDKLCNHPSTFLVKAEQCAYGLLTPSQDDPSIMAPALKPTKFLTNSEIMSRQLSQRCTKDHVHQPLVGGRCKDAAMYPVPLVQAVLGGIALQSREKRLTEPEKIFAMPMSYNTGSAKTVDFGPATYSSIPKVNGGVVPVQYDQKNFKDRYFDEYTGQILAPH